jgi:hypothetical protein
VQPTGTTTSFRNCRPDGSVSPSGRCLRSRCEAKRGSFDRTWRGRLQVAKGRVRLSAKKPAVGTFRRSENSKRSEHGKRG